MFISLFQCKGHIELYVQEVFSNFHSIKMDRISWTYSTVGIPLLLFLLLFPTCAHFSRLESFIFPILAALQLYGGV